MWICKNKFTLLGLFIEISAMADNWTSVSLSMVTMDTGMEHITEIWISPVTGCKTMAVEVKTTDCVFNNYFTSV